jgi:uncharacterized protein YraI
MKPILSAFLLAAGVLCAPCARAAVDVRVTGENVNLRSVPVDGEVVGQVSTGARLKADDLDAEWVQVAIPDSLSVWVYAELVKGGKVAVSRLNVRGGPGINYRKVGQVERGTPLEVRDRNGEWLRIAPPAGCRVWISREYVEPVPRPQPKPKPVTPPALPVKPKPVIAPVKPGPRPVPPVPPLVTPEPVRPAVPVKAGEPDAVAVTILPRDAAATLEPAVPPPPSPALLPAELYERRFVEGKSQGVIVELVGVVRRSGPVWRRPSKYRLLMRNEAGRVRMRGYLLYDNSVLAGSVGRTVKVSGREYWVQGVRHPVVVVDAFAPVAGVPAAR